MVSYDNPQVSFCHKLSSLFGNITSFFSSLQSFAAKGKFILENKLRGFAMWEVGGDYKNALLSSIRAAAEYS